MLLEVFDGERESVVDADERGDVPVEFLAEPFGKTTASPIPALAGRCQNLYRLVGALGHEHANAFATGVCGLSAGIVDADVAGELGQFMLPQPRIGLVESILRLHHSPRIAVEDSFRILSRVRRR